MNLKRITIKESGIKPSLYRQIRQHALNSMYRLNAKSADVYSFKPYGDTWEGGWSWLEHPLTWDGELAINLKDGKLYKLTD